MQPYPREQMLIDLVMGGLKRVCFEAIDELEPLLGEDCRYQFMTQHDRSGFFVPRFLYDTLRRAEDKTEPTLWGRALVPWDREFIVAVLDVQTEGAA